MDIKKNSSSFDEACFCLELLREKASDLKHCFVQYQQGNCGHFLFKRVDWKRHPSKISVLYVDIITEFNLSST